MPDMGRGIERVVAGAMRGAPVLLLHAGPSRSPEIVAILGELIYIITTRIDMPLVGGNGRRKERKSAEENVYEIFHRNSSCGRAQTIPLAPSWTQINIT